MYKLSKPFEFEEKTYEEIDLNLDGLKGSDLEEVDNMMTAAGVFAPVPAVHRGYCARVAARASKLPYEFFAELPAKDYYAVTQEVSNFLLATVSMANSR